MTFYFVVFRRCLAILKTIKFLYIVLFVGAHIVLFMSGTSHFCANQLCLCARVCVCACIYIYLRVRTHTVSINFIFILCSFLFHFRFFCFSFQPSSVLTSDRIKRLSLFKFNEISILFLVSFIFLPLCPPICFLYGFASN